MSNATDLLTPVSEESIKVVTSHVPEAKESSRVSVAVAAEETCPQCGAMQAELAKNWCRKCGYYPKLGIRLELEDYDLDTEATQSRQASPSAWKQIPTWVWVLSAGIVVLGVESLAARLLLPSYSTTRTIWSVGQLGIGAGLFFAMHVVAFGRATLSSAQVGVFDLIIKPAGLWTITVNKLPKTAWQICLAGYGLAAVALSMLIIGSIPYEVLLDWGFKPRPKPNLMKDAIAAAAANAPDEEMSLEEAVESMTGVAEAADKAKQKKAEKVKEENVDCLVIGYMDSNDPEPELTTLVLAASYKGTLQYVGTVSTDVLSPEERRALYKKFSRIERDLPIVKTSVSGTWVEPTSTCRVVCKGFTDSGRMREPLLKQMLADISLSR